MKVIPLLLFNLHYRIFRALGNSFKKYLLLYMKRKHFSRDSIREKPQARFSP